MTMPVTPVFDGGELLGSLTYFGLCAVNTLPCRLNRKETIAKRSRGETKLLPVHVLVFMKGLR